MAYEKLQNTDKNLVERYEAGLGKSLMAALGSVVSSKVNKREWVDSILQHKREEVRNNIWKLKFRSFEVEMGDVGEPILKVIKLANNAITTAVVPSPYASIAWAGVNGLLLVC